MIDVLFYDKRNNRQVWASELMEVKVVNLVGKVVGDIGYKSEECSSYKNWNCYTKDKNLIFLRLEFRDTPHRDQAAEE